MPIASLFPNDGAIRRLAVSPTPPSRLRCWPIFLRIFFLGHFWAILSLLFFNGAGGVRRCGLDWSRCSGKADSINALRHLRGRMALS